MARSDGTVYIDTLVDTKGFGRGMNTMQKQVGGLSSAIGKLGAVIATTFAVGKLIQFGKEAIDLGSDLQEVQNVVDVTFTTMSDKVDEFAKGAAEAAGLSETMAKRYTGTFGAMAKAFGFAESESFDMSTSLTQLAGDVASFYNLTQDEAYTKLKSVFTGETETLKDLGVVMTQNALDAYAMAEGYGKTTKAMTEQEKVALRYSFVLDQLSAASGDFQRTSDGWANQMRILQLNFDSFKANIGQALINVFTPLLKIINQVVSKMAQLSKYFVAFSEMLVGKSTSGGGGSPGEVTSELSAVESGYEGVADATKKAEKANKKYLSGLDEIRTFTEDASTDTSTSTGGVDLGEFPSSVDAVEDTNGLIEELQLRFPKLIGFLKESAQLIKDIFNDFKVGDFFKAGQDISSLITGIYSFISGAIDDVDWAGLGNKIGDFLAGIKWLEIIKAGLELTFNIWEAIAEVWLGAFDAAPFETAVISAIALLKWTGLGSTIFNGMKASILSGSLFKNLGTLLSGGLIEGGGFFAKLGDSLAMTFGGAGTLSESLGVVFGTIGTTIAGIVSTVGGAILAVFNFIDMLKNGFSWLNEILMVLGTALAAVGAVILGAPALIAGIVAAVVAAVATIVVLIKDNWNVICEWFSGIGEWFNTNVITPIVGFFNELWTRVKQIFEGLWIIVQAIWKVASTWFNKTVVLPIVNFFAPIVDKVGGFFSQLWEDIKKVWNNVSQWFETHVVTPVQNIFEALWNGIKQTFAIAINGIVAGIESAINFIIDGINGIIGGFNKVVSWAAKIAETDWGGVDLIPNVSIPRVNVPMLATGAVIPPNAPFMAVLGDQRHGTNIETPEALLRKVVREESGANRGGGQYQFTAQINRRTLFEEMIEEAKLRQTINGRNPFDLARV